MKDRYPKDLATNMAWRRKILLRASKDRLFREKCKRLFFEDPLFAFNAFFFTYDPRKRPNHMQPFCTYECQNELIMGLIKAINEGKDILVEKSRDMGVSWTVVLVFLWFWLNPSGGADFLVGSRKEEYVDKKGDMATLFEKVRYALYRLPQWLIPDGFSRDKHDRYMIFTNPETGASIRGESNNQYFASGGRFAGILFDEFAKWESTDDPAWVSAGDATPCRIPVSTPAGAGGKYYEMAHSGTLRKITLHWTLHPEKGAGLYCEWPKEEYDEPKLRSPWYDAQCERRTALEIAQELDIDYLGAGNPVFDGKAGKNLAYYRSIKRTTKWRKIDADTGEMADLTYEPRYPEGLIAIYEMPSKDHSYILASDVAEGLPGGDFSIVKVMNRETKDVVVTVYTKVDERRLAFVIKAIAEMYTTPGRYPWIGVETNGPGLSTFDKLTELEVPNLFMMPRLDATNNTVSYRKGWVTNASSRKLLIGGIKEYLNDKMGYIDLRCVGELGTFIYNKNKRPEARAGCHDDEVVALGICIQLDTLCPEEETFKEPIKIRTDGLPENIIGEGFDLEALRIEGEPTTIQERCMQQAIQKHAERARISDEED